MTLVVDWTGQGGLRGRPDAATTVPGEEELLRPLAGGAGQVTVGVGGDAGLHESGAGGGQGAGTGDGRVQPGGDAV